jgi:hypothetical protein
VVPPASTRNAELLLALVRLSREVLEALVRSFPGSSVDAREDAVSEALVAYVRSPDRWSRVWVTGGERAVYRYFRTVAWRRLRGEHRQGSRCRLLRGAGERSSRLAEQEAYLLGREVYAAAIARAAEKSGARDHDRVRLALVDALASQEPDTVVARRHAIRREYLNRARRCLLAEVVDALG